MKTFFLLFSVLLSVYMAAQKRPTQAQINQMKKQMEKEMKELERDDPEAGKLARQIMSQLQNGQTKTPAKNTPLPSVASPITPVKLPAPVSTPTNEEAKDQILWYKGKKINDSTIITRFGAIVQYSRKLNRIAVKPATGKDPFEIMVKELLKNEVRKKELIDDAASLNNGFLYYKGIVESLEEYSSIGRRYQNLLKNTINLPKVAIHNNKTFGAGKGGYNNILETGDLPDNEIEDAYNEVMQLKSSAPNITIPIPPEKECDLCYTCNIDDRKKNYEDARKSWDSIFHLYERTLVEKAIAVERMMEFSNIPADAEQFGKMKADLDQVILFSFRREEEKIDMLQQQFGKDYKRLPIVIEEMIGAERQRQLYGLSDTSSDVMEKVSGLIKDFDEFLRHEMDVRNYNLVFNIAFILGMERQKQLIGASDEVGFQYLDMINAFNRFKLELSIDFELQSYNDDGKVSMEATSKVETYKDIFVSAGRIDCHYQLFLTDIRYGDENISEKEYRIPMMVKQGKKVIYDPENGAHAYAYTGPALLYDIFPLVKIDFCKAQVFDTAFIEMPVYQDEDISSWAPTFKNAYTVDMMGYLSLLFFNPKELEGKTGDMQSIGKQMLNVFASNHAQNSTGFAQLDRMQANYYMGKELEEKQAQLAQLAINNKLRFLFDAKNNNETLINETNDASRNIDEKMKVTKAIVHVRVTHSPGDYRLIPKRKPLVKSNG